MQDLDPRALGHVERATALQIVRQDPHAPGLGVDRGYRDNFNHRRYWDDGIAATFAQAKRHKLTFQSLDFVGVKTFQRLVVGRRIDRQSRLGLLDGDELRGFKAGLGPREGNGRLPVVILCRGKACRRWRDVIHHSLTT